LLLSVDVSTICHMAVGMGEFARSYPLLMAALGANLIVLVCKLVYGWGAELILLLFLLHGVIVAFDGIARTMFWSLRGSRRSRFVWVTQPGRMGPNRVLAPSSDRSDAIWVLPALLAIPFTLGLGGALIGFVRAAANPSSRWASFEDDNIAWTVQAFAQQPALWIAVVAYFMLHILAFAEVFVRKSSWTRFHPLHAGAVALPYILLIYFAAWLSGEVLMPRGIEDPGFVLVIGKTVVDVAIILLSLRVATAYATGKLALEDREPD
jgi:hypothetical protein